MRPTAYLSKRLCRCQRRCSITETTQATVSSLAPPCALQAISSTSFPSLRSARTRNFSTTDPSVSSLESPRKAVSSDQLTQARAALDRACERNQPEAAEQVLRKVEEDSSETLLLSDYHRVLDLYIHNRQLEQAHHLLITMKPTPGSVGFCLVGKAWIHANQLHRVRDLLTDFMERGIADTICFNLLISECIKRKEHQKAFKLLHTMDNYARNGPHPEAQPDKVTMTSILQHLASRGSVRDCEALLECMLASSRQEMQPDAVTYSLVFKAYANASAVGQATQLWKSMQERYSENPQLADRPNTVVYNSYLSVLAKAGRGQETQVVLEEMLNGKHNGVAPDLVTYGTVLTAWKNAGNGHKALELLWKIPHPDRLCFSLTIAALAKQGLAKEAESLLEFMISSQDGDLRPMTSTHTAVLNAWAHSNEPDAFEHATRVLHEMESSSNIKLDTPVFHSYLKAIELSSTEANKVELVHDVFQRMSRARCRPNSVSYRHAIQAIASSQENQALEVAMQIYKSRIHLPAKQRYDWKLHTSMLEACAKLSPKGIHGDVIVEEVFRSCCREGVVSSLTITLLRQATSDDTLKRIFNTDQLTNRVFKSFPDSWGRNVSKVNKKR